MSKPKIIKSNRSAESAAKQFGETVLDNRTPVATPENVAFRYEVAGPFTRMLALAVDFIILFGVLILVGIAIAIISVSASAFMNEFAEIAFSFFGLAFFLSTWVYGVLCEAKWGRTIGKWLLRLRVLTTDGRPINLTQAFLRNFLRLADLLPTSLIFVPTGGVGFLVMSLNRQFRRLGDLAAGTIVIHESKKFHFTVDSFHDPRVAQLAEYVPASLQISNELAHTLSMYVQRREYFSPERTREIAGHLAIPLLKDFGLPADTSYDLLMCALYFRTFLATESRKEIEWRPPQLQQGYPPPSGWPAATGNPTPYGYAGAPVYSPAQTGHNQQIGYQPASQPVAAPPQQYRPVYQPPQVAPQPPQPPGTQNPTPPGDNSSGGSSFGGTPPGYG